MSFLTRSVEGRPGLVVDPGCPMIRKGFNGSYQFTRIPVMGWRRSIGTCPTQIRIAPARRAPVCGAGRGPEGGGRDGAARGGAAGGEHLAGGGVKGSTGIEVWVSEIEAYCS